MSDYTPTPSHQIEILIAKDGTITSTVKGIAGPSCAGIADWLANLGQITDTAHTEDYYKDDQQALTYSAGN